MSGIAVFDCFSGISGDMTLGALVDAGADLATIERDLQPLGLPRFELRVGRVGRAGIEAARVEVLVSKERRYGPEEMIEKIRAAGLAPRVAERAVRCVELLAEGEGTVHRTDTPHFHEVGGVDALIDITGTMLALESLDIAEAYCPVVTVGSGTIARSEHGAIPAAPPPAAAAILETAGFTLRYVEAGHELVTPTGAAILAAVAKPGAATMVPTGQGTGAGKHDPPGRPNALRVFTGKAHGHGKTATRSIALVEANIDDMAAELLAHARDRLLEEGALDAWLEPIGMKKGRAATKLCALVPAGSEERFAGIFLRETTTIGVRTTPYTRYEAEREVRTFETSLGPVRAKVSRWQGRERRTPEFEDVRELATRLGRPALEVYRQVEREIE